MNPWFSPYIQPECFLRRSRPKARSPHTLPFCSGINWKPFVEITPWETGTLFQENHSETRFLQTDISRFQGAHSTPWDATAKTETPTLNVIYPLHKGCVYPSLENVPIVGQTILQYTHQNDARVALFLTLPGKFGHFFRLSKSSFLDKKWHLSGKTAHYLRVTQAKRHRP